MSYSSTSELNDGSNLKDVRDFASLLGFHYEGVLRSDEVGPLYNYNWFEDQDYQSWTGIELGIYQKDMKVIVETRTPIGRSFFDLQHQNLTVNLFRKYFGGSFVTDEGKGRYLNPRADPPSPPASGCFLAFQRFGSNLISVHRYYFHRDFTSPKPQKISGRYYFDEGNPWLISNNLLLPFLIAILEDYWKSTYIALLRYSEKKESILRSNRILSEKLAEIADKITSVEQAFAESLSFQNVSVVCKNFNTLDSRVDFAVELNKPYHRRKISLFRSLDEVVKIRHDFIHRADVNTNVTDEFIVSLVNDIEVIVTRCYQHLTKIFGWAFVKRWHTGNLLIRPKVSDDQGEVQ